MTTTVKLPEGDVSVHPLARTSTERAHGCENLADHGGECGRRSDRFVVATAPGYPAGNGKTERRYACSQEHVTELVEGLWGIGYEFPED